MPMTVGALPSVQSWYIIRAARRAFGPLIGLIRDFDKVDQVFTAVFIAFC